MGSNDLDLRLGVDGEGVPAGLAKAGAEVEAFQDKAAAASRETALQEEADLKLIEAQYGQLGPAAAKAFGVAQAAAESAGKALLISGKQAETGGRGYERSAAQAAVEIRKLEAAIEALRAAGGDVAFLERRLESLQAQARQNSAAFGNFRKSMRDVQDETKIATRAAGEFEGTIGNLEDVVNSINPNLGNTVVKLLAIQSALFIVQQVGRDFSAGLKDIAISLGVANEEAEQFAKTLEAKFSTNPFAFFASFFKQAQRDQSAFFENLSEQYVRQGDELERLKGTTGEYAFNLRNVLAAQGYDVAKLSLEELLKVEEQFRKSMADRGARVAAVAASIRGDYADLKRDADETALALAKIGREEFANGEIAERAAAQVAALVKRYKDDGKAIPPIIAEWNTYLQALVQSHESLSSILGKVLSAVGVTGPEAINKQIDALREYSFEVERSGDITADQALLILAQIDQIRKSIQLLPEDQRRSVQGMLDSLEELEERYRNTAEVALAAFGVKTPEAIGRSIVAIQGLIDAFGPLDSVGSFEKLAGKIDEFQSRFGRFGDVTAEQARLIVGEIQKILDAIALLPVEEREALAEQEAMLRAQGQAYAKIALQRKEFSQDILATEEAQLEREREIVAQRLELLSQFASVFEQLQAKLAGRQQGGGTEDIEKLRAELKALEAQQSLSPEQVNRVFEIKDALAGASQAAGDFAAGNKEVSLTVGEVDDAIAGLVDSLKGAESGFNNLPLASRLAIENMLGRLQSIAQDGLATGTVLTDIFTTVGQIVDEAGGSMGDLGAAIARSQEDTLNLRREFGELEAGITDTIGATDDLAGAQKDAATKAKEASAEQVKALGEQAEAHKALAAAAEESGKQVQSNLSLTERLLEVSLKLKECWATTSIG